MNDTSNISAAQKPRKAKRPNPSVEMVLQVSIPLALYAYLDERYVDPTLAASQLLAQAVNAAAKRDEQDVRGKS